MQGHVSHPKNNEGVWLWLIKIIAGLLVIVVLAIHFIVNHAVVPGGLLSYADVIRYYKVPIVPVMEVIFLVVVVSHCLLGLRSIWLDLNPGAKMRRFLDGVTVIAGSIAILYGAWLVILLANK